MPFTLTINTDGAAFADADGNPDDYSARFEVARILSELGRIPGPVTGAGSEIVRDVNGNTVGTWSYEAPEPGASLSSDDIAAIVAEYDRIVRANAEAADYDVIGEVIANDGLPTVGGEIADTAADLGYTLNDADRDALDDAGDAYRGRLTVEREAALLVAFDAKENGR